MSTNSPTHINGGYMNFASFTPVQWVGVGMLVVAAIISVILIATFKTVWLDDKQKK
jgi:hypothetical protein